MAKLVIALGDNQTKASGNITDRIKTFEDACRACGIDPTDKLSIEAADELSADLKSIAAYGKLIIIARALNEGWAPNWNDSDERKWWPWFEVNKTGFGFSYACYAYWYTYSGVGSRLCFKNESLAEYAAKQFIDIYNDFLTL